MSASTGDTTQTHATTTQDTRGAGPFLLALWMAIGLAIYVLSVGPVARLDEYHHLPPAVGYVYRPLGILAEHLRPAGNLLNWYLYRVWHCTPPKYV